MRLAAQVFSLYSVNMKKGQKLFHSDRVYGKHFVVDFGSPQIATSFCPLEGDSQLAKSFIFFYFPEY